MNIMQRANAIDAKIRSIESENGYQPFTTFAFDLAVAVPFRNGVKDTYKRVVNSWLGNYKYFTEFILVLNHLCWFYYYNGNEEQSREFGELYYKAKAEFFKHFENNQEALEYYYNITD